MRRQIAIVALFSLCLCICTGCWDQVVITTLAKVTGISIDAGSQPNLLRVAIQVSPPTGQSPTSAATGSKLRVLSAEANTIWEAISLLQQRLRRTPFLLQLRFIVFGEELAKAGLERIIAQLQGTSQIRGSVPLLFSAGSAEATLHAHSGIGRSPGEDVSNLLRETAPIVVANRTTINDLLDTLGGIGHELALPIVDLTPLELKANDDLPNNGIGQTGEVYQEVVIGRTALFQRDRWVATLNELESRILVLLLGKGRNHIVTIANPADPAWPATIRLEYFKASYKSTIAGPGLTPPEFKLHLQADGHLLDISGGYNLKELTLGPLATACAENLTQQASQLINRLQTIGVDVLGLGQELAKHQPAAWKRLETAWSEVYPQVEVTVGTKIKIRGTEMVKKFSQTKR